MIKKSLWLGLVLTALGASPCMAQSFEPAFDSTSDFVNGEQDLQIAYYRGSFDGNVAGIYQNQTSEFGSPLSGDSNIALIEQIDTEASIAQIWQVGMGNHATIYQTGENNIARLAQVGLDHVASMRQEGSGNFAAALLQGTGAFLQATQTGESNYINVVLNTNSQLRINQEGTGNLFMVTLAAGASANISQKRDP